MTPTIARRVRLEADRCTLNDVESDHGTSRAAPDGSTGGAGVDDAEIDRRLASAGSDDGRLEVCGRVVEMLGVDGAAIAFLGEGRRETLCVSSPEVAAVEEWQFTFDEGPCVSAFRSARVRAGATDASSPWPALAVKARESGYASMAGVPLGDRRAPWGALDLYSTERQAFDAQRLDDARRVGGSVSRLVLDRFAGSSVAAILATTRGHVHQASGVVSARLGIPVATAFEMLRTRAVADDRLLVDVARDVLEGDIDVGGQP